MVRREPMVSTSGTMSSTSGTYTTPSGDPLISASRTTSPPQSSADMDAASTGRRSSGGLDASGFSQYLGDNTQMNLSAGSLGGFTDFTDFGGDGGQTSQLTTPHGSRSQTPTSPNP